MNPQWKYCPYCGEPINECDCDEQCDERFPAGYAEIEYEDCDSAEAINGARFDDINYLRHYER